MKRVELLQSRWDISYPCIARYVVLPFERMFTRADQVRTSNRQLRIGHVLRCLWKTRLYVRDRLRWLLGLRCWKPHGPRGRRTGSGPSRRTLRSHVSSRFGWQCTCAPAGGQDHCRAACWASGTRRGVLNKAITAIGS